MTLNFFVRVAMLALELGESSKRGLAKPLQLDWPQPKGRRLGRCPLLTAAQQAEALRPAGEGRSPDEIGQVVRVSRSTMTRFPAKARSA